MARQQELLSEKCENPTIGEKLYSRNSAVKNGSIVASGRQVSLITPQNYFLVINMA